MCGSVSEFPEQLCERITTRADCTCKLCMLSIIPMPEVNVNVMLNVNQQETNAYLWMELERCLECLSFFFFFPCATGSIPRGIFCLCLLISADQRMPPYEYVPVCMKEAVLFCHYCFINFLVIFVVSFSGHSPLLLPLLSTIHFSNCAPFYFVHHSISKLYVKSSTGELK